MSPFVHRDEARPAARGFDQLVGDASPDLRRHAIHRIRARRKLAANLVIYVLVNALLIYLWSRSGGFFWPVFSIAGWGIGLGFMALAAFGPALSEERIQREMRRLDGR